MLAGPLALFAASLFTGGALYVSLAEQPARLELDDAALLAEWKLSYARGSILQGALAILGFILGVIAWWEGGGWLWLLGGIVLLANWPYTLLRVMPLNRKILAFVPGTTEAQLHVLIAEWGQLHAVRTALGGLAALIFVWASC